MNELQLINENGKIYVDSRQVAKMIGKRHDNLIRDIDGYVNILGQTSKLRTIISSLNQAIKQELVKLILVTILLVKVATWSQIN